MQAAWLPYTGTVKSGFGAVVLLPPHNQHPADCITIFHSSLFILFDFVKLSAISTSTHGQHCDLQ